MKRRLAIALTLILASLAASLRTQALSFDLDSIAAWGKFPRFCVGVYRWGDRFFNTYDSAYVEGTGYKFNIKAKSELWTDSYIFSLPDSYRMRMDSELNISGGFYITYLAVSLGYDFNIGKMFNVGNTSRHKLNFKINCALLSAEMYWVTNDVGTNLLSYGTKGHEIKCRIPFTGINTSIYGMDIYYFINNKRYSRAAAFNYGKIQKRSQGSWFVGFAYWTQDFDFSFGSLPQDILDGLPQEWADNGYAFYMNNNNYAVRAGYAYNWVFHKHWTAAISESPVIGFKHGRVNHGPRRITPAIYNRAQASVVWNNRAWFAGIVGSVDNGLFYDKKQMLVNSVFSAEVSVGYRFNLW